MTRKHTPGPWEIITWAQTGIENERGIFVSGHKSPAYHAPLAKILENNPPLTSTLETHINKQEALANARLIATAPELLEFTKNVESVGEDQLAAMDITIARDYIRTIKALAADLIKQVEGQI